MLDDVATLLRKLRGSRADAESAARALKWMARDSPDSLHSFAKTILREACAATDVRVQWNLTVVLGTLPLKGRDKALAVDLLFERLRDASPLNCTFALQALFDLSAEDAALRARVVPVAREFLENGTAAMRARARRLLSASSERPFRTHPVPRRQALEQTQAPQEARRSRG